MTPADEKGGAAAEPGFDQHLAQLETLVGELEGGGLELEPAIAKYEEGIRLLKSCHATLETYRKRVEELSEEAEAALRPFEGDPDADDD